LEPLEGEVEEIVGPKGKHNPERVAVRHGHEDGEVTLGGRRIGVRRPRVRTVDGESEVPLGTYEHFADADRLEGVVLERMLSGVSTRQYRRAQEPVGEQVEEEARSTSKSAVSRTFVHRTRQLLWKLMNRPLADLRLAVMMLDGIELHGRTNIVALGITTAGDKLALGRVGRINRERRGRGRAAVRPGRPRAGCRAGVAVRDRRIEDSVNAVANRSAGRRWGRGLSGGR